MDRIEQIKEQADIFAEKHAFRVPYDGSNDFYDKVDLKASIDGFIAGAMWADENINNNFTTKEKCEAQKHEYLSVGYVEGKKFMTEKAYAWLKENARDYFFAEYCGDELTGEVSMNDNFIEDFKKAMEL